MKIPELSNYINKHSLALNWPFLIIYYFIVRMLIGVSYVAIYGFIAILLFLRISFERIALIFFLISIIAYISGRDVEANHYLSFVYGFLFLYLLKNLYLLFKHRLTNDSS